MVFLSLLICGRYDEDVELDLLGKEIDSSRAPVGRFSNSTRLAFNSRPALVVRGCFDACNKRIEIILIPGEGSAKATGPEKAAPVAGLAFEVAQFGIGEPGILRRLKAVN